MTLAGEWDVAGPDRDSFLATTEARLRQMFGLDICVLASVDPPSGLETSCEVYGIPEDPSRELRVFELEWFSDDPMKYSELARSSTPAGGLRLTADPHEVKRYVEIGEPNGIYDELRVACVTDGVWWATVSGYRFDGRPAFNQADVTKAASLSSALARGFRRRFLQAAVQQPVNLDRPPGAFNIDSNGQITTTTQQSETWLDTLDRARVSTLCRALVVGVDHSGTVALTVTGSEGPLVFHASRLKGSDDEISVVVEYPRPLQLTSLVVDAYELTPREREIAELVLTGLVTKQIARELEISEYTVQDHLKSVFAKTGTATRGELCAALYTRFYLEPKARGASPGPYGYFLSG